MAADSKRGRRVRSKKRKNFIFVEKEEGTEPLESRYQVEFLFSLEQREPRRGERGVVKMALAEVDKKMDSALGKCKTTGKVHKCKNKGRKEEEGTKRERE